MPSIHALLPTLLLVLSLAPALAAAQQQVLLVRHAEKAAEPTRDPALSDTGKARADALAAALADAAVDAIIVTEFARTQQTAAPLAAMRGITPHIVNAAGGGLDAHVAAVAAAVREHPDGTVLVVGHSNTLAPIIAALGGPAMPDLGESEYANLFVLQPSANGARLLRTRYGAADVAR